MFMPGLRAIGLMVVLVAAGCASSDDARVLQVLNQRGFGRPTLDANRQYYVGIGDTITISDRLHAEYNGVSETVRMDGTVTLPEVDEVFINGLTPDECTEVIRQKYAVFVNDSSSMTVRVTAIKSKRYYVAGLPPQITTTQSFNGDVLLVDAILSAHPDELIVDTDNIRVIRGDPENPLVIECNYDDIVQYGLTRDNIQIRENDVIYLTPSIVGYITYVVAVLVSPLKPIQELVYGYNNIITVTDSFGQGTVGYGYNKGYGGGFGGGF
jgi:protein involved in polysaccharide export with SLBB domain